MFAYTKIMQALSGAAAVVTDAYFNLVTLLLNTSSTNGAQNNTFLDSSTANAGSGWTITRNGNTTQGTFTPFSQTGWSGNFNTSTTYLTVTDTANLRFGSANFTIEAWVYRAASGAVQTIVSKGASTPTGWVFQISAADKLVFTDTSTSITGATSLAANTWYYVAVVRAGTGASQTTLYVNATSDATGTSATNFNQTTNMLIGADRSTTNFANGYISNLRLSNTNRTISSTPTTALTADANTIFLALNSNWFQYTDSTAAYTAMAVTGTPSIQAFSPFAPTAAYSTTTVGGSAYFDGTADYLTIADNAAFDIGAGEFSIEAFVYPNGSVNSDYIFGQVTYSTAAGSYVLWINSTGYPTFYSTTGGTPATRNDITSSTVLPLNSWSHICICRSGTTLSLFLNGTRVATQTYSSTIFNATNTLAIGADAVGGGPFNGYISSLRFLKGTSAYDATQSTITIPTAPPTNITNTSLLLNYTNAGIYDAAAKNVLETVGNAQVSTTQAKFGTTSMYFDGTGDWLVGPRSWSVAANENFTIEGWFYFGATVSTTRMILSDYNSGTPGASKYFSVNATGVELQFGSIAATVVTSTTSFSINTWYHIAAVRNNNTVSIYVNGTAQSVTNSTQSNAFLDQGTILYVGRWGGTTTYEWIGYMDELRFTKGVARYTSNFSVPTAAFPVQ